MDELERAAFAAWPALATHDHGGWHLRWANGYTKRANSANANGDAGDLTAVFRLPSFCTSPASDDALAARGYRFTDLSLVMAMPLVVGRESESDHRCEWLPDAAAWLAAWDGMASGQQDNSRHHQILAAIEGECAFAIIRRNGRVACRGLGVITGGYLGLFDIETHPDFRRLGLARALCSDLMAWGAGRRATTAFLQVVADNGDAISLYEGLGFRQRYHYWYRVGPSARRER